MTDGDSCIHARELISAALDTELVDGEREQLEHHLDRCPTCRQLATSIEAVGFALGRLADALATAGNADIDLAAAGHRVVAQSGRLERRARHRGRYLAVRTVPALGVLICCAVFLSMGAFRSSSMNYPRATSPCTVHLHGRLADAPAYELRG